MRSLISCLWSLIPCLLVIPDSILTRDPWFHTYLWSLVPYLLVIPDSILTCDPWFHAYLWSLIPCLWFLILYLWLRLKTWCTCTCIIYPILTQHVTWYMYRGRGFKSHSRQQLKSFCLGIWFVYLYLSQVSEHLYHVHIMCFCTMYCTCTYMYLP